MKVLQKDFEANQTGTAKIVPEESDDLWLLYNIISPGDYVTADTTRKVHLDSAAKGGGGSASRVRLSLQLKVTCRDFHKDSSTLRVNGRSLDHSPYVAAGSFHTLTLDTNKPFLLRKKLWNQDSVQALRDVTENKNTNAAAACSDAGLAVVLFRESHVAEIYSVGKGATTMVSKVEADNNSSTSSRAGKKGSPGKTLFFGEVLGELVKRVDVNKVKSVVIAGGGRTKEEFRKFMRGESNKVKKGMKIVVVSKGDCLSEVMGESCVMSLIKDSRVGLEIRAVTDLRDMVDNNSSFACYGARDVDTAMDMNAIHTLLISDELYRSEDVGSRNKYSALVKSVKDNGGQALVYSSAHVMAPHLAHLTGLAAILRFPLPHLDDDNDDLCFN